MKMKKKVKVYPSPPPLSSSSSSSIHHLNNEDDSLSVLRLLPATILVLVSVLSSEDREVLAYLITRGGTTISTSVDSKKKKNIKSNKNHKPPVFDCECFDCYTNYWFRWDSSPNRELIHKIIEAFENHHHLIKGGTENSTSRNKSKRGKKKEKLGRRVDDDKPMEEPKIQTTVSDTVSHVSSSPDNSSERESEDEERAEEESTATATVVGHKGLARKVLLPDVLGLFNSNFWRLWNPNA